MSRTGLVLSLCLGLLAGAGEASPRRRGDDRLDPVAGGRQLRERARSGALAALPDSGSGITRDVGSIAVIEHDGSNYDRLDSAGEPNYAARTPVAQRFYQTHGDNYDFLVVFTNFEFETGSAVAFHNLVRNDVRGIGKPIVDNGPFFGSPGRLKGYVDMAAVDRYRRNGLSLQPGDLGFVSTLNVVAHEVAHQWLVDIKYRDALGQTSTDLLGQDAAHWSYLLDSDASVMYGSDWTPNGDGTFTATRVRDTYSSLDLYLMGLLDPAKVGPITLLRNPAIDATGLPVEGATVAATTETVQVGQVVAAEGARTPDHRASAKEFRVGFIFLTAPGVDPSEQDLAAAERVRQAFASQFFALTRGVSIADTTLAEAPPGPVSGTPDLAKALAWLLARQGPDGRWADSDFTAVRDTAAALDALLAAGQGGAALQAGVGWLLAAQAGNADATGRRAATLATLAPAFDKAAAAAAILAQQNADGGFGLTGGYESDPLDTALALRALKALDYPLNAALSRALSSLDPLRSPSGGWPSVVGGELSTVVTAHVLLALQDWSTAPEAQALLPSGLAALLSRRNPDGGFGESPSTPYATALGLQVLLRASGSPEAVSGAIDWLQGAQHLDGSWEGSTYETALVLGALKGGTAANLVLPADGLVLDPSPAREGETVRVKARVRNAGQTPAGPSRARLHDGVPGPATAVSEASVPGLGPGEEAEVSFDFPTTDRAGDRTLYVVADADGEVPESREDDNATARALRVEGLLADLVIGAGDLLVDPNPPEEGEVAEIRVTVRNVGERAAGASVVTVLDGSVLVGQATLPALDPGEAASVSLSWDTSGRRGLHTFVARADSGYAVYESDELNNEAATTAEVTGPLPPGPDLAFGGLALVPSRLSTIPQTVQAEIVVRNLGRDPATSEVALYDGGAALGRQAVTLGPRSQSTIVLPVTVQAPGTRTLLAVADPDGALVETDETNNSAGALLVDPGDTLDLEVSPADVAVSPADVVVGERLTVTATVRNRGTAPVAGTPVILARPSGSALAELARTTVSLPPGSSTVVSLSWTTAETGDPLVLAVVADPFSLLAELSEANNRADVEVRVAASGLPNLTVDGGQIAFSPDPPLEGGSAVVSVPVRNAGSVDAGPFVVSVYRGDPGAGGVLIGETPLPGLAASSATTAGIPWNPVDARGAQAVFAVIDRFAQVDEYDESDNRAFRPFGVAGLPDLVLAAADVRLAPGYPRAGESVVARATVRNLGAQAAPAAVLRALEGEGPAALLVGEAATPALAPGESVTLELSWTPAASGPATLTVLADAEDAVREQDEGNNRVRRTVIVQDADLYLTEPYFSPDGDGVKDETALAYRATGAVAIVVSNEDGEEVRTLAEGAPESGSVSWDGRDAEGRLLPDGDYTLNVEGEGGAVLARISAVIDTNRSSLHEAAGTGEVAIRNLTCQLPDVVGPAWMPSEDETLFIVDRDQGSYRAGLLSVGLEGVHAYLAEDPWYQGSSFASPGAVSPDGREVLIRRGSELYAVELATGARRLVSPGGSAGARWSPDGRWIATESQVLARDGAVVAEITADLSDDDTYGWAWSADGQFLAKGNTVVRRDGSDRQVIALPDDVAAGVVLSTEWRSDGRVFTAVCPPFGDGYDCSAPFAVVLDPKEGTASELPWLSGKGNPRWSPAGLRVVYSQPRQGSAVSLVARQDGSVPLQLVERSVVASPRALAASYQSDEAARPGQACAGQGLKDTFAVTSLLNLTSQLTAARLPANNGILLRGTVADQHLDHYRIEYASQSDPASWRPLGAASELAVLDDVLGVFVPQAPDTYLIRLTVEDRAGNVRSRTRVLAWDRVPSIANLTQDEFLISPNGDGVKDAATFNYLMVEPTRVEVRVVGPEGSSAGTTVRRLSLEHPVLGPASFVWDGRDDGGAVVPDGRYTVLVNDVPLRVDVDATPPDVAWGYADLRVIERLTGEDEPKTRVAVVAVDRLRHVMDAHLKSWFGPGSARGTRPVYEPERDANGDPVYEEGRPKPKLVDGRAADLRETCEFGRLPDAFCRAMRTVVARPSDLVAEDHAGNRSVIPVFPVEERMFVRTLDGDPLPPLEFDPLLRLQPVVGIGLVGTFGADRVSLRLEYRPATGGAWSATPAVDTWVGPSDAYGAYGQGEIFWTGNLLDLGLSPDAEYRGRFAAPGRAGEVYSEEFRFRVCRESLRLLPTTGGDPEFLPFVSKPAFAPTVAPHTVRVGIVAAEPMRSVVLEVLELDAAMAPTGYWSSAPMVPEGGVYSGTVLAPNVGCATSPRRHLAFTVRATGVSGREYPTAAGPCISLATVVPSCGVELSVEQEFPYCSGTPDNVSLHFTGRTDGLLSMVEVTRGAEDPMPVGEFQVVGSREMPFGHELLGDVTGLGDGLVAFGARMTVPSVPLPTLATAAVAAIVDRTPPVADVLEPAEGAEVCTTANPENDREDVRVAFQADDAGAQAEVGGVDFSGVDEAWRPAQPACADPRTGKSRCGNLHQENLDFPRVYTGQVAPYYWDVTDLPSGDYALRMGFCDRAGNRTSVVRHLGLRKEPPNVQAVSLAPEVFSPNAVGRLDKATFTARIFQSLRLTAEVWQGEVTVRTLAAGVSHPPGLVSFAWDGRDDAGNVVADGAYTMVVTGGAACGQAGSASAQVVLDTTPPTASISAPAAGENVGIATDVRGEAVDAHLDSWDLWYGAGTDPVEWTPIYGAEHPVAGPAGLLKTWAPVGDGGALVLRLVVRDTAGNESEVRVPVSVAPRTLIDRFTADPALFSPNGDGRRETLTIAYQLTAPGTVSLEVRQGGAEGTPLRTLERAVAREGGSLYQVAWDGTSDAGEPLPPLADGEHAVWIEVTDAVGASQEAAVALILDRAPPEIVVDRPAPDAFVNRDQDVLGRITEPRFGRFEVTATQGAETLDLRRGKQAPADGHLAPLSFVADGAHTLTVFAEDAAENRSQVAIPFFVDSVPPVVALHEPAKGAVLDKGAAPIPVRGTASDDHLREYVLRFGPGELPAYFVDIARGTAGGTGIPLGSWAVASVPDGTYTLQLTATDEAANASRDERRRVVLDSVAPFAALTSPADGGFVNSSRPVLGRATDANLASWRLEWAPGAPAEAVAFGLLASGAEAVDGGALGDLAPLPPDGTHTLRLTVEDEAGHSSTAVVGVVVDTVPPAAPAGLAAEVVGSGGATAEVRLTWTPNTEPDLAGYRVFRDGDLVTPALVESPALADPGRVEGSYQYTVVAVDRAGNASEPAPVTARVDLTPPVVDVLSPAPDAAVSGSLDVRGTAFSPDDFQEYRLLVGAGASPSSWTLLRRSTLGVAAGVLGTWTAVGDGPYVLALEAGDTSGNQARVTVPVRVDNQPPDPPALTSVEILPAPDALTATWQPSASTDLAGYLVYRNGRVANAPGLVLGDLRAFLVAGPSYADASLADGEHCYRIVAMDQAGNVSAPSSELCRSLDNRAPQASILQPADGSRFEFPVRVVAYTPDTDVASVVFEVKRAADTAWSGIGSPDAVAPFETTLDPLTLSGFGPYDLRAVATDVGGRTDPAPAPIAIVYGDTTPPAAPRDVAARVDAQSVALSWSANAEADLDEYRVSRDGELLGTTSVPAFADAAAPLGAHRYEVSAVDLEGNEGLSGTTDALVYALSLDVPFPVTSASSATLSGAGALAGTAVEVLRDGMVVASSAAAEDLFRAEGVPLAPGPNRLVARGVDSLGNRSVPSGAVLLISNAAPGPVAGLEAAVTDHDVALTWTPASDANVHGYLVKRGAVLLTPASLQTQAASVTASEAVFGNAASRAFDGDPSTAWIPPAAGLPATWTIVFPEVVLVDRVDLRFLGLSGDPAETVADYRVEARWEGEFIPLAVVRGNVQPSLAHVWPAPFATDALRVVVESGESVGLAEVGVSKVDAARDSTYADTGAPDGVHTYAVSAVDRYGAEGSPASLDAAVGDIEPPAAPTGLTAAVSGRDVQLGWSPSPEPDVDGYVVVRDGVRVATVVSAAYRDVRLPDGEYGYTVLAVDAAGNESPESEPALAVVALPPAPPGAPAIFFPTDAAHPVTLPSLVTDVRGSAPRGSVVSLLVNGALRDAVFASEAVGFRETGAVPVVEGALISTAAPGGTTVAYIWEDEEGATHTTLVDTADGSTREVVHEGYEELYGSTFSPDGGTLAYVAMSFADPDVPKGDLFIVDLASGARTLVEDSAEFGWEPTFSPDGGKIAFAAWGDLEVRFLVLDLASGVATELASFPVESNAGWLKWSPDGTRLALLAAASETAPYVLSVLDVATGSRTALLEGAWTGGPAEWTADGARLAVTLQGDTREIVLVDAASAAVTPLTDSALDAFAPQIDPTGSRVAFAQFVDVSGTILQTTRVQDLATGETLDLGDPLDPNDPHAWLGHDWLADGRLVVPLADRLAFFEAVEGAFEFRDVALQAGENELVAQATDPATGLTGPESAPVRVTVTGSDFPDLAVSAGDVSTYPSSPTVGQGAQVSARVRNLGGAAAPEGVSVLVSVLHSTGTVLERAARLPTLAPSEGAFVSVPWTPAASGTYLVRVRVDQEQRIAEGDESNNAADRGVLVTADGGLAVDVRPDRTAYPARTTALFSVSIGNGGAAFDGSVRTAIEDAQGRQVAVVDERPVTLDYGATLGFSPLWSTGSTYAGDYAVKVRATDAAGNLRAEAGSGFSILPDVSVAARVVPDRASVAEGASATFAARVENRGANAPLDNAVARLRLLPEGSAAPAFEMAANLPRLLPGAAWEGALSWPSAAPAGRYTAQLLAVASDGATLATSEAAFAVEASGVSFAGTVRLEPADVLSGDGTTARLTVTNTATAPATGVPVAVEVLSGADAVVLVRETVTLDLAAGETREATLTLPAEALLPSSYPAFLRVGEPGRSLDRTVLRVHGAITPPSVDSPADGATVATDRPALCVNNGSSAGGADLGYEFEVFADAALRQPLVSAAGIPETAVRTCWTVTLSLAENGLYYWRARAADGFSASAFTAVASFTVDAANEAPSAPVPDTPRPGARVASREPVLTVTNAVDLDELDRLTYEFRLGTDAAMTQVVTSASGVPEGTAFTSWPVPVTLEENATYWWSARASDGRALSPWSVPIAFVVDSTDETPSAPTPLRPIGGDEVATFQPELVVSNANDPEGRPLTYVFELDRVPSFDSPDLQTSGPVAEGSGETAWTPPFALADNTTHFWRAAASDGNTQSAWASASFFVNLANDPPSAPVPVDPSDGQVVTTPSPTLRVRNATDADRDVLTYEFAVTDEGGAAVDSATGVPETATETSWTVSTILAENGTFFWSARAHDGEATGPWSEPQRFRVNAVQEPPTAPAIVSPAEGAVLGTRQATFTVGNAASPDGLALTYAFELFAVDASGQLTLIERAEGIAEGASTTSWTAAAELADGAYAWRARAEDGAQAGPWTATAHFTVAVNVPPAAPTGLQAVPGDSTVALSWNASPEPDVVEYRVYRGAAPGGPYDLAGAPASPALTDTGLANGVTVHYVVTAFDGVFESAASAEVAATPAPTELLAEIRFDPSQIAGECLVARCDSDDEDDDDDEDDRPAGLLQGQDDDDDDDDDEDDDDHCAKWVHASIELHAGWDPSTIDVGTVRLGGSVSADPGYAAVTDSDGDGVPELTVRFAFSTVASLLVPGPNTLSVSGQAGSAEFRGAATITVAPLAVDLRVTPRTLKKRSNGEDVLASLTFRCSVEGGSVDAASLRLNETVPVKRVVNAHERSLKVKFDRAAVIAVLPAGDEVEVRVSGTLGGLPFVARDHIRVIE